jgi:hypothetical protein
MKNTKFYLITITSLILVTTIFAQPGDPIAKGIDNYLSALNSKNDGLVESAIVNIIKLKMNYPERDYTTVTNQLDRLTHLHANKIIRIEAYVVLTYMQYPERFDWLQKLNGSQIDDLLSNLVYKIHQQIAAR